MSVVSTTTTVRTPFAATNAEMATRRYEDHGEDRWAFLIKLHLGGHMDTIAKTGGVQLTPPQLLYRGGSDYDGLRAEWRSEIET